MNEVRPQFEELLFSSLEKVIVASAEATETAVRIEALSTARQASCPYCGCLSGRIHGSYLRFPRDLPTAGKAALHSRAGPELA